jgi:hypothetical protein
MTHICHESCRDFYETNTQIRKMKETRYNWILGHDNSHRIFIEDAWWI